MVINKSFGLFVFVLELLFVDNKAKNTNNQQQQQTTPQFWHTVAVALIYVRRRYRNGTRIILLGTYGIYFFKGSISCMEVVKSEI